VRTLSITLTEDEMATLDKFAPFIEQIKGVMPQGLVSIVHKVEAALREPR